MIKLKGILLEQGLAGGMATNTSGALSTGKVNQERYDAINDSSLKCVPKNFRYAVYKFKQEVPNYTPILLRACLGIIGRESSFASGTRYTVLNPIKWAINLFGGDSSEGPAQMTKDTQAWTGVKGDISDQFIALKASYYYLAKAYKLAVKEGYSNSRSANLENGTGSAALDIAIASYNIGLSGIKKYCNKKVEDNESTPGLKVSCDDPNAANNVQDYIPNFKTTRWDGVDTSTHGYVEEVADWFEKLKCIT